MLESDFVECVYGLCQSGGTLQRRYSRASRAGTDGVGRRRSEQLHGQLEHSHQYNVVPGELFGRIRETHLAGGSCRNSCRREAGLARYFPVWLLRICLEHGDSRQLIVDLPVVRVTAEFLRLHPPGLHHLPGERRHLSRVANGGGSHGTGAAKGRQQPGPGEPHVLQSCGEGKLRGLQFEHGGGGQCVHLLRHHDGHERNELHQGRQRLRYKRRHGHDRHIERQLCDRGL